MKSLKIGQLATAAECPVETIRYYEREGLLSVPTRTAGNYRLYDRTHLERLSFIRHCRTLDMTLDEIRSLLRFRDAPQEHCDGVNQLLDEHLGHVSQRILELQALEKQLQQLRRQCRKVQAAKDCGILHQLGGGTGGGKRRVGHVHGPRRSPHKAEATP